MVVGRGLVDVVWSRPTILWVGLGLVLVVGVLLSVWRGGVMFLRIGRRVSYANVVMTFALVFAMTGGAFAAKKFIITSRGQIKPSVLKQIAGKNGKDGVNGVNGTNGVNGKDGAAGAVGLAGVKGDTGAVGPQGAAGTTGFTKTLPGGETELGDWSVVANVSGAAFVASSVSFVIPLKEAPPTVVYVRVGQSSVSGCPGTAAEPAADKGHLCIYAAVEENSQEELAGTKLPTSCPVAKSGAVCFGISLGAGTADPFGFSVMAVAKEAGIVNVSGSWAVTAE